jgi:hypothetical protein
MPPEGVPAPRITRAWTGLHWQFFTALSTLPGADRLNASFQPGGVLADQHGNVFAHFIWSATRTPGGAALLQHCHFLLVELQFHYPHTAGCLACSLRCFSFCC